MNFRYLHTKNASSRRIKISSPVFQFISLKLTNWSTDELTHRLGRTYVSICSVYSACTERSEGPAILGLPFRSPAQRDEGWLLNYISILLTLVILSRPCVNFFPKFPYRQFLLFLSASTEHFLFPLSVLFLQRSLI